MTNEELEKMIEVVENHIQHCVVNLATVGKSELSNDPLKDIVAYTGFKAALRFVLVSDYTAQEMKDNLDEDVNLVEIYSRWGLK